jgi:hypothetical protein
MFKKITRAKAIPAKRQLFKTRTRVETIETIRGNSLVNGATTADKV